VPYLIGANGDLGGHIDEQLRTDIDKGDRTHAGLVVGGVTGEAERQWRDAPGRGKGQPPPIQTERPGVVARRHEGPTPPRGMRPHVAAPTAGRRTEPRIAVAAQDGTGPDGGQLSRTPRSRSGQLTAKALVGDDRGVATMAAQGVELKDRGPQVGSRAEQSEAPLALGRCHPQLDPRRPVEDLCSLSFPWHT
jgi:hypothetical protein